MACIYISRYEIATVHFRRFYIFFFSAEKYCKLVRDEGGIELLQGLTANPNTSQRVRELSQMTLDKCYNNLEHLENNAQQTTYNSQLNLTQQ